MSSRYPQFPPHVVSVTECLDALGLIWHASREALERGKIIHECCALLVTDRLHWSSVDPQIAGEVESCNKFWEHMRTQAEAVEQPRADLTLGYCGTADLITPACIFDFKSGSKARWHKLQLGAYWGLYGGARKTATVYLQEDGAMAKLDFHPGYEACRDFQVCLNYYFLRERYGNGTNAL